MADRIIIFAENGRTSTRGIRQTVESQFTARQRDEETLDYTLDYSNWLGSDTISSVSRTASGTIVSSTSNSTTQSVQSLHGQGYVDIKITTAAGRIKEDRIYVEPRRPDYRTYDGYRSS